jgi:hypothetical protein
MNRLVSLVAVLLLLSVARSSPAATEDCRTGGAALAEAYVLLNPLYAAAGEFEEYVVANSEHFGENGDATRCAAILAQVFIQQAMELYDPNEQKRRDELNTQLDRLGISRGPSQGTASNDVFLAGVRLMRLARGLPSAAEGDYTELNTPANDFEQLQIFGEQVLRGMLDGESLGAVMPSLAPMLRELADLERRALRQAATEVARSIS